MLNKKFWDKFTKAGYKIQEVNTPITYNTILLDTIRAWDDFDDGNYEICDDTEIFYEDSERWFVVIGADDSTITKCRWGQELQEAVERVMAEEMEE